MPSKKKGKGNKTPKAAADKPKEEQTEELKEVKK